MELVPTLALASLVWAFVDFLKYVKAGDSNSAVTQLITWASGVGALALVAQTDFATAIPVGEQTLATLNGWSIVFAGLTFSSTASVGFKVKTAIDGSDTAKTPDLLG